MCTIALILDPHLLLQTTSPTGQGRSDSPVYTNLQELKISQSSLPPVPSGSPLHIHGDWETHKDLSGRHFYYNRATGERTWKPPRTRDASGSTGSFRGEGHQGTAESEVSQDKDKKKPQVGFLLKRDVICCVMWFCGTFKSRELPLGKLERNYRNSVKSSCSNTTEWWTGLAVLKSKTTLIM